MEKDKLHKDAIDKYTDYLVGALENMKKVDAVYDELGKKDQFEKLEYVEREEDPQLKAMFEE